MCDFKGWKKRFFGEKRNKSSIAGNSLPELMVGLVVLALVFGSGFTAISSGYKLVENSRDNSRVAQILQSEMENLRTTNWVDVQALGTTSTFTPETDLAQQFVGRYTCTRRIYNRYAGTANERTDQKTVELIAEWTDANGIKHERKYVTLITENGLTDYYYRSF